MIVKKYLRQPYLYRKSAAKRAILDNASEIARGGDVALIKAIARGLMRQDAYSYKQGRASVVAEMRNILGI